MVKVRKDPPVGWGGGMRKGQGLVTATVSSRIFCHSSGCDMPWVCEFMYLGQG